jgi:hypothetical protein
VLKLIENGEVYTPAPVGKQQVLLTDGKIGKVGEVDRRAVEAVGVEYEVIDATGCLVVPGFIDPHMHLLGGSGEEGFATQTPEFFIGEIVPYGITTAVGALGVDTTMKTMAGLLAKVKGPQRAGAQRVPLDGRLQRAAHLHHELGARRHHVPGGGDRHRRGRHLRPAGDEHQRGGAGPRRERHLHRRDAGEEVRG